MLIVIHFNPSCSFFYSSPAQQTARGPHAFSIVENVAKIDLE